jgi:integrase
MADYTRIYDRMVCSGNLPEHARARQTYYSRRAALVWATLEQAKDALRRRDKAAYGSDEWAEAMADLEQARRLLQRYPPDPERQHQAVGSSAFTWAELPQGRQAKPRSRSKRHALAYLVRVPDWRAKLFEHIGERHRAAAAVCALSGARPCEVALGVEVTREADSLLLRIRGAKLTQSSGQPERVLRVALDSVEALYLAALAEAAPVTISTNPQALSAAVGRAGKKAFPLAKVGISPYCWRHNFAASLIADTQAPVVVAQALGHLASDSQTAYTRVANGALTSGVLGVRATLPVRHTHRPPPPLRQPSSAPAPRPTF